MNDYEKERVRLAKESLDIQKLHVLVTVGIPFVLYLLNKVFGQL